MCLVVFFPSLACVAVQEMSNLLPPFLPGTDLPQTYELQHALGKWLNMKYLKYLGI